MYLELPAVCLIVCASVTPNTAQIQLGVELLKS